NRRATLVGLVTPATCGAELPRGSRSKHAPQARHPTDRCEQLRSIELWCLFRWQPVAAAGATHALRPDQQRLPRNRWRRLKHFRRRSVSIDRLGSSGQSRHERKSSPQPLAIRSSRRASARRHTTAAARGQVVEGQESFSIRCRSRSPPHRWLETVFCSRCQFQFAMLREGRE
ncbi:MAG: hypothetical protein FD138_3406, partial [Planctomycetota bacterium]